MNGTLYSLCLLINAIGIVWAQEKWFSMYIFKSFVFQIPNDALLMVKLFTVLAVFGQLANQ